MRDWRREEQENWNTFHGSYCECERTEVRLRRLAAGIRLARQCLCCGRQKGSALRRQDYPYQVPPWDDRLQDDYQAKRDAEREAIQKKHEQARHKRQAEWWDWYNDYLQSPAWQEKRLKVLKRANHICEGCHRYPAAVCDECHDRVHAGASDASQGS
jgi:hypothetical protein